MGPFSKGWTEEDVERVLRNGNPDELLYIPIVVGMNAADCDREWAENICVSLADHPHFNVRGNAVLGFGHIVRTCRALNTEKVLPIIDKALRDDHEYVRGHAEDALSDIKIYLSDRGEDLEE